MKTLHNCMWPSPRFSPSRLRGATFTLVELLTVIAILLILVAMLLPTLEEARYASMRTVCATQVGEQLKAQMLFAGSNDRRYTTQARPDPTYLRWAGDTTGWWASLRNDYVEDPRIMLCPILENWGQWASDLDWYNPNNANYGAWNTGRSHIQTGYAWMAGFDYAPAPDEPPPVNKLAQIEADSFGVTHRVDNTTFGGWDIGHGGTPGLKSVGFIPFGSTTRDQPIGYLDGHVKINPRQDLRYRFHHTTMGLGGYPSDYYF